MFLVSQYYVNGTAGWGSGELQEIALLDHFVNMHKEIVGTGKNLKVSWWVDYAVPLCLFQKVRRHNLNRFASKMMEGGELGVGTKKFLIFFVMNGLILLLTACGNENMNKGSEPENVIDLESRGYAGNVLEDMQRNILQKAATISEKARNWVKGLERERFMVIYPSDWEDDPYGEKIFPEGVIKEIADALQENSLMEFIDAHAAKYQILSREEIEKYAISSDTVYNFIEEMERTNSHMVVKDETRYKKREEKIRKVSETDAIWYMLPLDLSDNIVVYGKYGTYKFDLRGFEWGFELLSINGTELYFISWGEDNLVIQADENLGKR